jgi:putative flippase GtrA
MKKYNIMKLYKKNEEIINYLIVGGLTTLVSLLTKYILLFTFLKASNAIELQIAIIISWICAVTFAYFANRVFVFKSKNEKKFKEAVKFYFVRISTLLMEMVIMWFFITLLKLNSNNWVIIWTIFCQILITIVNYILSKFVVFKK